MTHDDSVQIAATRPARRRAFARIWRAERASGRDTIRDVASGPGRTPVARMMGSAARSRRKFSALQSLEISQNAEEISTRCGFPRRRRIVAALAERGGRRAPHFSSVNQAGLTRSATASTALAQPRGDREETFPPCNPLKNQKTGTESGSRTGRPVTPSSRDPGDLPHHPAPLPAGPPAPPSPRRSRSACQAAPALASPARSPVSPPAGFGERVAARRQHRRKSSVG